MVTLKQPNEVLSLVWDVTASGLKMVSTALGSGPTSTLWTINDVLSLCYSANKLQVGTVAAGTFGAVLYQPQEILRQVFDPSVNAIRVAKVSTGGGPITGRLWQVDEVLSGAYDPVAKAIRVVSVSAGSGPKGLHQVNKILSSVYDSVAHAIQEVGV